MSNQNDNHQHHILSTRNAFIVAGVLLFFTWITVTVAEFNWGKFNFLVAFVIASIKATCVALIFMNLKHDRRENVVIFLSAFLFLAIFISLTVTDLFFRGDVYVKGQLFVQVPSAQSKSKLKNPWISTPALISAGKEIFVSQCVSCHGSLGKGDGPAAAMLRPPPRNFTTDAEWKNGRKPSQVFKTLKDGLPNSSMSSFMALPVDDRWAVTHFILSLGPSAPADTPADLAKIGLDPKSPGGGEVEKTLPSIPIDFAIKRIVDEAVAK